LEKNIILKLHISGEGLLYCLTIPLIATALANQDDIFLHK